VSTPPLVDVSIPTIEEQTQTNVRMLQEALLVAAAINTPDALSGADLDMARSNVRALAFVQAVGIHGVYRYLRDFIARQAIPGQAKGRFLDAWLNSYKMPRKTPAFATGAATGTGSAGMTLVAGTLVQSDTGVVAKVAQDATVASNGTLEVTLLAMQSGTASNVSGPATFTLISSYPGVNAELTATQGLSGGTEQETDAYAIYRLRQRLGAEPRGGCPQDYARWAMTLPGITRAWGLRNPAGPTSAGVVIMADDNTPYGIPNSAQRQAVYDYIADPRRGPPDELIVVVPTAQVIDFSIRLKDPTPAKQEAVIAELGDLFYRAATPGVEMPHTAVIEVVTSAAGDHDYDSPGMYVGQSFLPASAAHLLVLGTVTFT